MRKGTAKSYFRYSFFVLREFRWPLIVIFVMIFFGGALFHRTVPNLSYSQACFGAFMLMLAQATFPYPDKWYDQILFYVIPIIGVGVTAQCIVNLGYLVFTSKRKLQEWWIMEASSYKNHIVICGLGRVGYRIAQELRALGEDFVAIERNRESLLVEEMQGLGVPVIFGEVRLKKNLELANVGKARAIILATDDDLANLDSALTAREIKPDIRVVMRLFDDTLANKVAGTFNLPAISTSQVSAPAFVAAATGRSVFHSFQLDGQKINVADFKVGGLAPRTIAQVQTEFSISVVLHKGAGHAELQPAPDRALKTGDTIVVVAPVERLQKLEAANR